MTTENFAKSIRIESLKMVFNSKGSHIGSALSYVEILAILYNEILNYLPSNPFFGERDRFILSKGHAFSSLYACLALKGFFNIKDLNNYGEDDSQLMNHVSHKVPGVEFSTGSLGHGLPFAVGKAKALKLQNIKAKVFVLIGDGEIAEGSNFEALLFASHHQLDNLILIIDNNNLQSLTNVKDTLNIYPLDKKFEAFGWEYANVDGHDLSHLRKNLKVTLSLMNGKPKIMIAKTIKGRGVSFMENSVPWHYKSPDEEELMNAIDEINNA